MTPVVQAVLVAMQAALVDEVKFTYRDVIGAKSPEAATQNAKEFIERLGQIMPVHDSVFQAVLKIYGGGDAPAQSGV